MSTLIDDASDSKHCAGYKEDVELERKIQDIRGNLQTRINAKQDPFVLRFPPEIASHIFFLSIDSDGTSLKDELKKLPMPFLLGSVCRGWRLLARSTPELWSTVSFSLAKPTKPPGPSQLEAVSDWLQLSGDVPLTLHVFKYWGPDSISQEAGCNPVIDILNEHSGRWHELLLDIPARFFPRFCGTYPPNRLCNLHVKMGYHGPAPTFKMRSRPSPTNLTIFYFPISTLDINWDNLTILRMTLTAFDGCIEAIQQAPLLEVCSITLCRINFLPSIPNITVRHMRLRTLKLFGFPSELLCGLLDVLDLPSLQAYHHQTLNLELSIDNVISFLNRSGMDLKQLTLDVTSARKEDLKNLLTAVPSLQNLQLDFWCAGNTFVIRGIFEDLSSSPPILGDDPGFFPSLQSWTISTREIFGGECIPPFFTPPHRKLLRLEINKTGEIEMDTLHKIIRLFFEGFDIRIIGGRGDVDYLQQFTKTLHEANELEFLDRALESESVTAAEGQEEVHSAADEDKKGCLSPFSSFISRLFCRR
jgi:hypothetical protein